MCSASALRSSAHVCVVHVSLVLVHVCVCVVHVSLVLVHVCVCVVHVSLGLVLLYVSLYMEHNSHFLRRVRSCYLALFLTFNKHTSSH